MSVVAVGPVSGSAWTTRRLRWVVVGMHALIVAIPVILVHPLATASGGSPAGAAAPPLGLVILALQLRHGLATTRGERPRGGGWTLLAMAVLVYLPLPWFGWNWVSTQGLVIASALMVLRGRAAAAVAIVVIAAANVATAGALAAEGLPLGLQAYGIAYVTITLVLIPSTLYGSARLVRVLDELNATRTELAELAVGRDRLQLARNLHDLLGQSLSAISLKGDLAIRLLRRDPPAALAEIHSLTEVARDALKGVRAVTRDQHTVTLSREIDGAAALLFAAGIATRVEVDLSGLPAATEDVLAWAVREGVTNVLRHSHAEVCSIVAGCHEGTIRLEINNDGVIGMAGEGSGLIGLQERARALAGTATAATMGDGRFRLVVELPGPSA